MTNTIINLNNISLQDLVIIFDLNEKSLILAV